MGCHETGVWSHVAQRKEQAGHEARDQVCRMAETTGQGSPSPESRKTRAAGMWAYLPASATGHSDG